MRRRFSGQKLRQFRLAAGLKPEQLALRVDRSVHLIHQLERDVARPSVTVLAAFADLFDCPVDDLFVTEEVRAA